MSSLVCSYCGLTVDDAAGGACSALAGPEHNWVEQARCLDCGMPYNNVMKLDLVLPRVQWLEVHPGDGGVLCANCIVKRASKMPGALSVSATIVFCPVYERGEGSR